MQIFEDTFQNSPIHLLYYEKTSDTLLVDDMLPELSPMSWCRLKRGSALNVPESAFDLELLLVLQGVAAEFVSKEQYLQLLFILGQKASSSAGNQ